MYWPFTNAHGLILGDAANVVQVLSGVLVLSQEVGGAALWVGGVIHRGWRIEGGVQKSQHLNSAPLVHVDHPSLKTCDHRQHTASFSPLSLSVYQPSACSFKTIMYYMLTRSDPWVWSPRDVLPWSWIYCPVYSIAFVSSFFFFFIIIVVLVLLLCFLSFHCYQAADSTWPYKIKSRGEIPKTLHLINIVLDILIQLDPNLCFVVAFEKEKSTLSENLREKLRHCPAIKTNSGTYEFL